MPTTSSSSNSEDDKQLSSDSVSLEPPQKKNNLSSTANYRAKSKYRAKSGRQRKYNKKWEKDLPWLEYDENYQGAFCKICRKRNQYSSQKTGGAWITKPFKNWKKAVEKMRAHANSDAHIRYSEAEVLAAKAEKEGSILQQLRSITEEQRIKNRKGIKALLRCTHFIARNHIPHTTKKFAALVDLIVTSGKDLMQFTERCARNATYTSTDTISDFLEALGLWVEEFQLKRLCKVPFYSDGDESSNIATIEELSLFFCWAEMVKLLNISLTLSH